MQKNIDTIHNNLYELLIELERIAKDNKLDYNLAYGTALGAVREGDFINWDTDLDIIVSIDEYESFCNILEQNMEGKFHLYTRKKNKNYYAMFNRFGFLNIPHDECHIDIFPMVGAPEGRFKRKLFWKAAYLLHLGNGFKNINIKKRAEKASKKAIILFSILKIPSSIMPNKLYEYLYNKLKTAYPMKDSDTVYNLSGSYKHKELIPKTWLIESEYKKIRELKLPVPKEWDKYLKNIYGDYMIPKRKNYV